jgi:NAD(P)-dependent dehydrogenase (short-subunit alcohol dehydrogenase family)
MLHQDREKIRYMNYFVTGATGFIGRHLVDKLLAREGMIYFLVLERELPLLEQLYQRWNVDKSRVVPIIGDLAQPGLGVSEADINRLRGNVRHLFHLAAIYDLSASAEIQEKVNIQGTRNAIDFAEKIQAGCFHMTSSIASAGLYDGTFREDMFDEAEKLDDPYFRTKHESEGIVRKECKVPWRIYRPGMVVGHSETGEINKVDGPYYLFKTIQRTRKILPPWVPIAGLEGGRINMVPVDFASRAMDHIAHKDGLDGKCFHLTDPNPKRFGEIYNIFAGVAHAPQVRMFVNAGMFAFIPSFVKQGLYSFMPIRRLVDIVLQDLSLPPDILRYVNYPTRFDCRQTLKALEGTDIKVPDLSNYAHNLWDYWERHLDPDLFVDRTLSGIAKGKVVLITGGSYGIGKAAALRVAEAGAKVILVARGEDKLLLAKKEIEEKGGTVFIYPCDLTDFDAVDKMIQSVETEHGGVDILINNAGRSIRRSVAMSVDRFHDYERVMRLNFFGSLRVTMGFLPTMIKKKQGHVINVSSIAVLNRTPRFSAYSASKAALEAFSNCANTEFNDIKFTIVNMPLVRTPMIEPTKFYRNVPTSSPEDAADLIQHAIIYKPERLATRLGIFAQVLHAIFPKLSWLIMNTAFHSFPEVADEKDESAKRLSPAQNAFAQFMRGIHW